MAYLGLARKWRPQTFKDLVGQEHIATTINNAIKKGRISQGYLFTGTRGIGKTSASRIFAKVLRCQNAKEIDSIITSCEKCTDCKEIAEGRSVDVLEIDGASNNGVDAVREIRENVKFLPSSGKYKIYIIDEVHMLTTAAFNALLKTLEEPPPHIIFIFATTDPQKIPETVLSRCQRFDFKRVSQKDLHERLKKICDAEGIAIKADALAILAREAEGSMRDGISLLDQVLSVAEGKEITARAITSALGLVDKQTVLDAVTGIIKNEPLLALEAVGKIYMHGFDLKQFGREVLRMIRTIMIAKLLEESKAEINTYFDLSDVDVEDVKELLPHRTTQDLDMLFRLLSFGLEDVARSTVPKLVMDILIVKMATSTGLITAEQYVPNVSNNDSDANEDFEEEVPRPQAKQATTIAKPTNPTESQVSAPKAAPVASNQATELNADWWKKAVQFIKNQKPLTGTLLEHLAFVSAEKNSNEIKLNLTYSKENSFYHDQLKTKPNTEILSQLFQSYCGCAVRLDTSMSESYKASTSNRSLAELEEDEKRKKVEEKKRKVLESEALQATQQLLGAKLEKLELKGD